MKPSISLCMIVLNEEDFIGRSLQNASPYVDEIIIVDGGSKDKTVQIATRFTKNIYNKKWSEDYARQRNFAITKAHGQWILFLDADEIFDKKLLKSLRSLAMLDKRLDAFAFPRLNYIDGKLTEAYPDRQIRLFRNNGKIKYQKRLHEIPSGWKFLTTPSDLHIIHRKSSKRQLSQTNYYKKLAKKYRLGSVNRFYKRQLKPG